MFPRDERELRRCYGRAAAAVLIATLAVQGTAMAAAAVSYRMGQRWLMEPLGREVLNVVVTYPISMLVIGLMLRRNPTPAIARGPTPGPGDLAMTLAASMGLLYLGSILTRLALSGTDTADYANQLVAEQPLWCKLVFTAALAPVFEEIIFRRLLLDRLLFLGDGSAILLSSLFFGLFHTNLYQLLYAFLVGLALGYVRIITGRLGYSIALHMALNLCCGVLIPYLPEQVWTGIAAVSILSVAPVVLARQPWRQLYPGPMDWFTPGDKVRCCLTSVGFWVSAGVLTGLSALFIWMTA